MKQILQDYQQALISRHYNSNFSDETKSALNTVIEEIGEIIKPKIEWEQGLLMETISVHDKSHMIFGYDQFGNYWEAIGHYSLGELVKVEDPTLEIEFEGFDKETLK